MISSVFIVVVLLLSVSLRSTLQFLLDNYYSYALKRSEILKSKSMLCVTCVTCVKVLV